MQQHSKARAPSPRPRRRAQLQARPCLVAGPSSGTVRHELEEGTPQGYTHEEPRGLRRPQVRLGPPLVPRRRWWHPPASCDLYVEVILGHCRERLRAGRPPVQGPRTVAAG
eukprot:4286904-Alexandrium_andersonii.AAC.1